MTTESSITSTFEEQWTSKEEFIPFGTNITSAFEEQWTTKEQFIPFVANVTSTFIEVWTVITKTTGTMQANEISDTSEINVLIHGKTTGILLATDTMDISAFNHSLAEQFHLYVSQPPDLDWGYYDGTSAVQGLIVQRDLTCLLSSSSVPIYSNWLLAGIYPKASYTRYDKQQGYSITTLYKGGFVCSGSTTHGTDCIVFIFRPTTSRAVALQRGMDTISVNLSTKVITVTSAISHYGFYPIGDGFYALWAVMTGTSVSVFPGGINNSGSVDWLQCQILQGCVYPAPIGTTSESTDALYTGTDPSFYVASVITQLLNQSGVDLGIVLDEEFFGSDLGLIIDVIQNSIDLGSVPIDIVEQIKTQSIIDLGSITDTETLSNDFGSIVDDCTDYIDLGNVLHKWMSFVDFGTLDTTAPTAPYTFFGSSDVFPLLADLGGVIDEVTSVVDLESNAFQTIYFFLGGIAIVGGLSTIITKPTPSYMSGNVVTLNDAILKLTKCGVAIMRMYSLYDGWKQSSQQRIFTLFDELGTGLIIYVEDETITINLYGVTHSVVIENWFINFGVLWGPDSVTVLFNEHYFTYSLDSVNLNLKSFSFVSAKAFDEIVPKSTWLLRLVLLLGADSTSELPSYNLVRTIVNRA